MPDREPDCLTQEEVDALPEGTEVVITWSGGNGPHRYTISKYQGASYTTITASGVSHPGHRIDFVGPKPLTVVRLSNDSVSEAPMPDQPKEGPSPLEAVYETWRVMLTVRDWERARQAADDLLRYDRTAPIGISLNTKEDPHARP